MESRTAVFWSIPLTDLLTLPSASAGGGVGPSLRLLVRLPIAGPAVRSQRKPGGV